MEKFENDLRDEERLQSTDVTADGGSHGVSAETEHHGGRDHDSPDSRRHHHHRHHHRHGSHHGHSGHGGGSSHNSKGKEQGASDFLKKNRSVMINIACCTLVVVMFIIMTFGKGSGSVPSPVQPQGLLPSMNAAVLKLHVYTEPVCVTHRAVMDYADGAVGGVSVQELWSKYKGSVNRLDTSVPFTLKYKIVPPSSGASVTGAHLYLYDNADYRDGIAIPVDYESGIVQIQNLRTDTEYHFRLNIAYSDGTETGGTGVFTTMAGPRFVTVDGAANVRDIGGWKTSQGTVKQGLLYRGSELDGRYESSYSVTDSGKYELCKTLGIRCELDLRGEADEYGILGSEVRYSSFAVGKGVSVFNDGNSENLRSVFSELAKADNYPMYMHCTYGRESTGTVCYLLGAVLGMSEDDLNREYCLGGFSDGTDMEQELIKISAVMSTFTGDTLQQKAELYLLSIGVTADELNAIKSIFTE